MEIRILEQKITAIRIQRLLDGAKIEIGKFKNLPEIFLACDSNIQLPSDSASRRPSRCCKNGCSYTTKRRPAASQFLVRPRPSIETGPGPRLSAAYCDRNSGITARRQGKKPPAPDIRREFGNSGIDRMRRQFGNLRSHAQAVHLHASPEFSTILERHPVLGADLYSLNLATTTIRIRAGTTTLLQNFQQFGNGGLF